MKKNVEINKKYNNLYSIIPRLQQLILMNVLPAKFYE